MSDDEPKERLPPRRGQYIRVVAGSDAPHGRVVKVTWIGLTSSGLRVGFRLDGRKLTYTSVENVEVVIEKIEPEEPEPNKPRTRGLGRRGVGGETPDVERAERDALMWAEARFGKKT